jgi:galactokinase
VVQELREGLGEGLSIVVDGDVPSGAGLSSSAALECAVALALRDLFALDLGPADLVDVARRAENDFVGAPTGILDQSASLLCTTGHALFLDTRDRSSEQVPFDLAGSALALLVIDSGTTHDHAEGGYGDRRRECEAAADRLGVSLLREVDDVGRLDALLDGTAEGEVRHRRARHVVTEDARVLEVVATLRAAADPRAIGPVLTAGHASLRDDFEVSVPLLDACVDAALAAGAHGARMVGGGFGGSAIALVDVDAVDEVTAAVDERFAAEGQSAPRTFVTVPSAGARRLA